MEASLLEMIYGPGHVDNDNNNDNKNKNTLNNNGGKQTKVKRERKPRVRKKKEMLKEEEEKKQQDAVVEEEEEDDDVQSIDLRAAKFNPDDLLEVAKARLDFLYTDKNNDHYLRHQPKEKMEDETISDVLLTEHTDHDNNSDHHNTEDHDTMDISSFPDVTNDDHSVQQESQNLKKLSNDDGNISMEEEEFDDNINLAQFDEENILSRNDNNSVDTDSISDIDDGRSKTDEIKKEELDEKDMKQQSATTVTTTTKKKKSKKKVDKNMQPPPDKTDEDYYKSAWYYHTHGMKLKDVTQQQNYRNVIEKKLKKVPIDDHEQRIIKVRKHIYETEYIKIRNRLKRRKFKLKKTVVVKERINRTNSGSDDDSNNNNNDNDSDDDYDNGNPSNDYIYGDEIEVDEPDYGNAIATRLKLAKKVFQEIQHPNQHRKKKKKKVKKIIPADLSIKNIHSTVIDTTTTNDQENTESENLLIKTDSNHEIKNDSLKTDYNSQDESDEEMNIKQDDNDDFVQELDSNNDIDYDYMDDEQENILQQLSQPVKELEKEMAKRKAEEISEEANQYFGKIQEILQLDNHTKGYVRDMDPFYKKKQRKNDFYKYFADSRNANRSKDQVKMEGDDDPDEADHDSDLDSTENVVDNSTMIVNTNMSKQRAGRLLMLQNIPHDPVKLTVLKPPVPSTIHPDDPIKMKNEMDANDNNEGTTDFYNDPENHSLQSNHHSKSVTLNELPKSYRLVTNEKTGTYFSLPCDQIVYPLYGTFVSKRFDHLRNITRLAARQLLCNYKIEMNNFYNNRQHCTESGSLTEHDVFDTPELDLKSNLNDRLLHLLWNKSTIGQAKTLDLPSRLGCLVTQTKNMAKCVHTFYTYSWKNQKEVAFMLGVANSAIASEYNGIFQLVGYERTVGNSMFSKWVLGGHFNFHQRLLKLMVHRNERTKNIIKIIWRHPDNDTETRKKRSRSTSPNDQAVKELLFYLNDRVRIRKQKRFKEDLRFSGVTYSYAPGTIPPIPTGPLDVSGFAFGPRHPFSQVLVIGRVSEVVLKLTITALITKLVAQDPDNKSARQRIRSLLKKILKELCALNRSYIQDRYLIYTKKIEVPLAFYYNSVMQYCSVYCHSFIPLKDPILTATVKKVHYYDSDSESEEVEAVKEVVDDFDCNYLVSHETIREMATGLCEVLNTHVNHAGLRMFSRLHVTHAVAKIANMVPSTAAEIISRPLDNNKYRTPFDLFRHCLAHCEECGYIVDAHRDAMDHDAYILCKYFVKDLHDVAICLSESVARNPTDIDCLSWYIGILASCFLVASGNKIGSGAHCYPSAREEFIEDEHNLAADAPVAPVYDDKLLGPHEVRMAVLSFDNLRLELLKGFQLLLHVAKRQSSQRVSLAISSFLEWREVWALLIGPIEDEETESRTYDSISKLHQQHFYGWLTAECPKNKLVAIYYKHNMEKKTRLDRLAMLLENDPSTKTNWIDFVNELGPMSRKCQSLVTNDTKQEIQEDTNIQIVDNETSPNDNTGEPQTISSVHNSQWGEDRCEWWYSTLLRISIPETPILRILPFLKSKVCTILQEVFSDVTVYERNHFDIQQTSADNICFEWINEALVRASPESYKDDFEASLVERNFVIDGFLPKTYHETLMTCLKGNTTENTISNSVAPMEFTGIEAEAYEMICYKLLIMCHLSNSLHPNIEIIVLQLLIRGHQSKYKKMLIESNPIGCLIWLYQMGVDVLHIIENNSYF